MSAGFAQFSLFLFPPVLPIRFASLYSVVRPWDSSGVGLQRRPPFEKWRLLASTFIISHFVTPLLLPFLLPFTHYSQSYSLYTPRHLHLKIMAIPTSFGFDSTATEVASHYANEIKGKTVLITGVSPNGLGAEAAISIAKNQPKLLILAGRSIEK